MPYKLVNGLYIWVEPSDNASVSRPLLLFKTKYKLKPGEQFVTLRGRTIVAKPKNELVSADNRSTWLKKQDLKTAESKHKLYQALKDEEAGEKVIRAAFTASMPSTYIGPAFNNNDKSYIENVMSGEGSGDATTNLALDIVSPFVLKGIGSVIGTVPQTVRQTFLTPKVWGFSGLTDENFVLKLSQFPKGYQSIFEQRLKNGAIENLSKENGIVNTESVPIHFNNKTTQELIDNYSAGMGYPVDKKYLGTMVRGGGYTITDLNGKKRIVIFPKFIEEKYGNPMATGLVFSHEFDHGIYTPIKIEGFGEKKNEPRGSLCYIY